MSSSPSKVCLLVALLLPSCGGGTSSDVGSTNPPGSAGGSGGSTGGSSSNVGGGGSAAGGHGGATSAGGNTSIGGGTSEGGNASTGGATSAGGNASTGGMTATGGATSAGGAAGGGGPSTGGGGAAGASAGTGGGGACFGPTGMVPTDPFKLCHGAADCVVAKHAVDCCGTIADIGIAASSANDYATCEGAWAASLPACGCDGGPERADDGNVVMPGDVVTVACVDFTSVGGVCKTSVDSGAGGAGSGGGSGAGGSGAGGSGASGAGGASISFPEVLEGIWLVGWEGDLNHFSWIRFHGAAQGGGVADILSGMDLTLNGPYWPCSGAGTWNLAQKPDTVAINFPASCPNGFEALTFSSYMGPPAFPSGSILSASLQDLTNPTAPLMALKYPDAYCDAAFTTCMDPLK